MLIFRPHAHDDNITFILRNGPQEKPIGQIKWMAKGPQVNVQGEMNFEEVQQVLERLSQPPPFKENVVYAVVELTVKTKYEMALNDICLCLEERDVKYSGGDACEILDAKVLNVQAADPCNT
jgi:hypothetical protein